MDGVQKTIMLIGVFSEIISQRGLKCMSYDPYVRIQADCSVQVAGLQQQEVKFQDPIFRKFQDIFVGFTRLKTQKMHILCAHKCYSLKQISIAVHKMLLRQCYT